MKILHSIQSEALARHYISLFNELHSTKIGLINLGKGDLYEIDFGRCSKLHFYFFGFELGLLTKRQELDRSFALAEVCYLERIDGSLNLNDSVLTFEFSAATGAIQVTHKFNKENLTGIAAKKHWVEGLSLISFDFGTVSEELIFKLALELGMTEETLNRQGKYMLPFADFPLPPKDVK